jgi:hypothetical protein
MGINYKGSQGQIEGAVVLQEEEYYIKYGVSLRTCHKKKLL